MSGFEFMYVVTAHYFRMREIKISQLIIKDNISQESNDGKSLAVSSSSRLVSYLPKLELNDHFFQKMTMFTFLNQV